MNEATQLETRPARPPSTTITTQSTTLIDLLRAAVDKGADVATLERLSKLYEAAEAREAKKAFDIALADAKSKIKPIIKDREVQKANNAGKLYGYESFAAIAEAVDPILSEHGLYYTFPDPEHPPANPTSGHIYVTCRLSHRDGYYIESTKSGPPDAGQNRNAMQAIGSSNQYLQRYALRAVLGLAVAQDSDGATKGKQRFADRPETIGTPAGTQPADHVYDSSKPEIIEGSADMQWQDWSKTLLRMINAAPSRKLINAWMDANVLQLQKLEKEIPAHSQFVSREITKRLRKVK